MRVSATFSLDWPPPSRCSSCPSSQWQRRLNLWRLKSQSFRLGRHFNIFLKSIENDRISNTRMIVPIMGWLWLLFIMYCSVNHQSGLPKNTFSKLLYIFFNILKCAANYVIWFEVYDGFIGQNILKLWGQERWPFGPGWAALIPRIRSWTFRLPCS